MGWSGGTFTRTNGTYSGASVWASDEGAGIGIEAVRQDTHDQDLAQGINACLAKDGTNSATADLALGSHKITGLANGTSRNHAHTVAQAQDGSVIWGGTSSGSANAQTISLTPSPGAYATGQTFRFKAGYTNTASATLNVNSLGAVTLYKDVSGLRAALGGSDLIANGIYDVTYDSASGGQFVLHGARAGAAAFTPNVVVTGGTWTPSYSAFYCSQSGQVMTVQYFLNGVQTAAPATNLRFDLPSPMSSAFSGVAFRASVNVYQGSDTLDHPAVAAHSGGKMDVYRADGTSMAAGALIFTGTFSYFTA